MFVLRIPVTPSAVEQIKSDLTKALAAVKSSHRVEALGRGLGFQTYAALLSASRSPEPPVVTVSGKAFVHYLENHSFDADPAEFYVAAARVAIRGVLDAMPRLSVHGIGFGRPQRNADGSRQTPEQQYAKFVERRKGMPGSTCGTRILVVAGAARTGQANKDDKVRHRQLQVETRRGKLRMLVSGRKQTRTPLRAERHAYRCRRAFGLQMQGAC